MLKGADDWEVDGETCFIHPEEEMTKNLNRLAPKIANLAAMDTAVFGSWCGGGIDRQCYYFADVSIVLDDAPEQSLQVTTRSTGCFLLPWKVRTPTEEFDSWDFRLSLALRDLLPDGVTLKKKLSREWALRRALDYYFFYYLL